MIWIPRCNLVAGGMAIAFLVVSAAHAELTAVEQAAVFKAAGFEKAKSGQYIRCKEEPRTASYSPGRIEVIDLNGDGQPEAWVKESSLFCYGHAAEHFVLVTKEPRGWRVLLDATGIPVVLETKRQGWPDIEVGGPGMRKFPAYRWNAKAYVLRK